MDAVEAALGHTPQRAPCNPPAVRRTEAVQAAVVSKTRRAGDAYFDTAADEAGNEKRKRQRSLAQRKQRAEEQWRRIHGKAGAVGIHTMPDGAKLKQQNIEISIRELE
jgi:hypothetical protein